MKYEYIRIVLDFGDLEQLNRFGSDGWRVSALVHGDKPYSYWALLERPLPLEVYHLQRSASPQD